MRTSAWVTILGLAGLAVACGDQPTEVVPDREGEAPGLRNGGMIALATSSSDDGLSITTDKDDYAPGDTVWFTGAGWPAEDTLDILLTDSPTGDEHRWWIATTELGTFRDSTYVVNEGDLDVTFTLTATSRFSGRYLTVTFTDGNFKYTTDPNSLVPTIAFQQFNGACGSGTLQTSGIWSNNSNSSIVTGSHYDFTVPAVSGYAYNGYASGGNITVSPASSPSNTLLCVVTSANNGAGSIALVYLENTTTELGHTPASTLVGQQVTFTATVKDHNGATVGNKGSVTFYEFSGGQTCNALGGATALAGPVNLSNNPSGQASFQTNALTAGTHAITGCYSGTTALNKSFGSVSHVVSVPDAQAPTVNCTVPNPTLWYGANVNVPCTASDPSGLAVPADASFTLSTTVNANNETATAGTGNRSVCDVHNNCAPVGPFVFKVDRRPPVVSCGTADGVWHADNVEIACTATDGGSGVTPGDESFDLVTSVAANTEDANAPTVTRNVTDLVNNSATAGPVTGNKVDKKAPAVTCGIADNNWHADNVLIHCTATDGGSGIETADASFNLTTNVAANTETANAQTGTRDVADKVGNSATAGPVSNNQVDKKAPQFTCEAAPSAWSANDVTRDCIAVDGGSGLDPASDASFNLSTTVAANTETDDAQTGNKQLSDAVGNKSTAGPLGNNKVDKKDPQVTCGNADNDWHANDVSIGCTASDGGSGLANNGDASFNLVTTVGANSEIANASTGSRNVADVVGHTVTAGPITGNKVDKKAPAVACAAADGNWHAGDVSVHCTATDGGSGIESVDASFDLSTSVPAGTETADAQTDDRNVADKVGNGATAGPVGGNKVDKKAPQFTCEAAPSGWSATDVTRNCIAVDGGSGVSPTSDESFGLQTTVAANTETDNAYTGTKQLSDAVGNKNTAGPLGSNKVDKKGPTLSLTCPNAPILLNQPVSATWNATDGGSGVAAGFLTGSFSVPTNTVGGHTATAAAGLSHDNVGNTSTASPPCGYGVNYGFAGFFTPVDNANTMNGANSGQAIPLKWTLKDFNGAPVTTLTSVNVTAVSLSCGQGVTTDLVEEYAAGASGLINKGDGSYQFNWKTPTSYAKSCKTLKLDLGDGSPVKVALFEFKK
jgi:hypothetical protein